MSAVTSSSRVLAAAGIADQVFSSMSNGVIMFAIAVVTTPESFGRISLLLTFLMAAVGALRGALGTPLLLTARLPRGEIRNEGSHAVTLALAVSPLVGAGMWLADGAQGNVTTLLLIAATPVVLVQDVLRFTAIAEGRPHAAAIWDGLWAIGSAGLLVATWVGWSFVTAPFLLGGWALLALVSLVGLAAGVRVIPSIRAFRVWMTDQWQHRLRYGIESGLEQAAVFAMLAAVAVLLGDGVTGAIRGALTLLAPIAIIVNAIPLIVIPESARRAHEPPEVWRSLARITALTTVMTVSVGMIVGLVPQSFGELLLGPTFHAAQHIIPVIAFQTGVVGWGMAMLVYLRALNRSADALWLKTVFSVATVAAAVAGAAMFHTAMGVAVGIALAMLSVTVVALFWLTPWKARRTGGHQTVELNSTATEQHSFRRSVDVRAPDAQ